MQLARIEHRLALAMVGTFGLDISALALDMTNFATYIDTTNDKAPIAARGKAKQKRADLRLVGLGLVITRDGGIPLVSHAYPGNRPDVTQFATMIDLLVARHTALAAALGGAPADPAAPRPRETHAADDPAADDGGVRRRAELSRQPRAPDRDRVGVRRVDPTVGLRRTCWPARLPTDTSWTPTGSPALTALEDRRRVFGADRRVVLTHSPSLHTAQTRGFDQTMATATAKLSVLADTLARGHTRRARDKVTAEITHIVKDPWVRRVVSWQLTGC